MGELGDCVFSVFDAIGGAVGIEYSGVEDSVEFEGDVVGCYGGLRGDFEGRFFEGLDVGYALCGRLVSVMWQRGLCDGVWMVSG